MSLFPQQQSSFGVPLKGTAAKVIPSLKSLVKQQQNTVEAVHERVYDDIQRQCWHWISTHIQQGSVQCLFEVPVMMMQYPLYSVQYIGKRLIADLRAEGMKVWLDTSAAASTHDNNQPQQSAHVATPWVLVIDWSGALDAERERVQRVKQIQHDLDSHRDFFESLAAPTAHQS